MFIEHIFSLLEYNAKRSGYIFGGEGGASLLCDGGKGIERSLRDEFPIGVPLCLCDSHLVRGEGVLTYFFQHCAQSLSDIEGVKGYHLDLPIPRIPDQCLNFLCNFRHHTLHAVYYLINAININRPEVSVGTFDGASVLIAEHLAFCVVVYHVVYEGVHRSAFIHGVDNLLIQCVHFIIGIFSHVLLRSCGSGSPPISYSSFNRAMSSVSR